MMLPFVILPITIESLSSKNNPSVALTNSWKCTLPFRSRTNAPLLHFLDSETALLIPVIFVTIFSFHLLLSLNSFEDEGVLIPQKFFVFFNGQN